MITAEVTLKLNDRQVMHNVLVLEIGDNEAAERAHARSLRISLLAALAPGASGATEVMPPVVLVPEHPAAKWEGGRRIKNEA